MTAPLRYAHWESSRREIIIMIAEGISIEGFSTGALKRRAELVKRDVVFFFVFFFLSLRTSRLRVPDPPPRRCDEIFFASIRLARPVSVCVFFSLVNPRSFFSFFASFPMDSPPLPTAIDLSQFWQRYSHVSAPDKQRNTFVAAHHCGDMASEQTRNISGGREWLLGYSTPRDSRIAAGMVPATFLVSNGVTDRMQWMLLAKTRRRSISCVAVNIKSVN